ncbi:MAG: hypothetical protein ACR2JC_06000 [Chloroflexota bacterium]|nr:MAG: hypothetical protein DLM70_05175 [Chloroflexota bacterium]
MIHRRLGRSALASSWGRFGLFLVILGETLIVVRWQPVSAYSFPFLWLGYILYVDAATAAATGKSLFQNQRRLWLALFPISTGFWWLFELLNLAVHNWIYVGGEAYTGVWFVVVSSLDFSTVLPAVWVTALFLQALNRPRPGPPRPEAQVPRMVLNAMLLAGALCLTLPLLLPRLAFGLIWGSLYFLLDPINYRFGRPAMISEVWNRRWRYPLCFAFAALTCGFFWESWNYWALPKWKYNIPYVGFWHIFEMPVLGWFGYLPFGLELFAMTNFVLPLIRLRPLPADAGLPRRHADRRIGQVS